MRKVLMVAIMMAMTIGACAQPGDRQPMKKEQMIDRRIEMLDSELKLSDQQKQEIRTILEEDMKDMPERGFGRHRGGPGRPDGNGQAPDKSKTDKKKDKDKDSDKMDRSNNSRREEMQARREEMQARREATDKKIMAVLNEEQQKKYAEMQKNRRGPGHGPGGPRRGGPGGHRPF